MYLQYKRNNVGCIAPRDHDEMRIVDSKQKDLFPGCVVEYIGGRQ